MFCLIELYDKCSVINLRQLFCIKRLDGLVKELHIKGFSFGLIKMYVESLVYLVVFFKRDLNKDFPPHQSTCIVFFNLLEPHTRFFFYLLCFLFFSVFFIVIYGLMVANIELVEKENAFFFELFGI